MSTASTRPVLRYHGGKWRLAEWIIGHFPRHRFYVEPYGGAASVLMLKPRSAGEVYNDLDDDLVNLFGVLRDPPSAARLKELLALTPFGRSEFRAAYVPAADSIERARRLVVRSFQGFGSTSTHPGQVTGFRSKRTDETGATPAQSWATYPAAIAAMTGRIRGVVIECRPAVAVLRQFDGPETLHYADPPYPLKTRRRGNPHDKKGYVHEMTDDDHRELAGVLRSLSGLVVLSGYPCDLYDRELYPDWRRYERPALADGARERTEVLWLNEACASALDRERRPLFGREGVALG